VRHAARHLIDPLGRDLAAAVEWWELPGLVGSGAENGNPKEGNPKNGNPTDGDPRDSDPGEALSWPVAVVGQGPPLLLLHGFDSCFLEFRRLVPLLAPSHQLFIPDLFGFGFSPRPAGADYSPKGVLTHLEAVLAQIHQRTQAPVGLIGASMGGSAAVELARRQSDAIARLLLLSPAGLTGRPMPVPPLLDALGVRFLALPGVRRGLCRSAFADPDQAVGPAELEIASLHLASPGWAQALGSFARSGGFAGSGSPLPPQPLQVLWGQNDRILRPPQKRAALALLGDRLVELADCGHLPHIDQPVAVAEAWQRLGVHQR
jgi:pimeloyl-ACP methyl ester carboxylesterase